MGSLDPVQSLPSITFSPRLTAYTGPVTSGQVEGTITLLEARTGTNDIYAVDETPPVVMGVNTFELAVDIRAALEPGLVTGVQSEQLGVFDPATLVQTGEVATTFTLRAGHPLRVLSEGASLPAPYADTVTYEFDLEVTDGLFEATGGTTMTVTADVPFGQNIVTLTGYSLSEYTGA